MVVPSAALSSSFESDNCVVLLLLPATPIGLVAEFLAFVTCHPTPVSTLVGAVVLSTFVALLLT